MPQIPKIINRFRDIYLIKAKKKLSTFPQRLDVDMWITRIDNCKFLFFLEKFVIIFDNFCAKG